MKITCLCVLSLVHALGCTGRSGAKTAREFFDKAQEAMKSRDHPTLWKMLSKGSQVMMIESTKDAIQEMKANEETKLAVRERLCMDKDPTTLTPEELAVEMTPAYLRTTMAKTGSGWEHQQYVREEREGDNIILVTNAGGKEEWEFVLVRESGLLKLDFGATRRYLSKKLDGLKAILQETPER